MSQTRATLLHAVQHHGDKQAWFEFEQVYRPLIESWLRRFEVAKSDVEDLVQDVLLAVASSLPQFRHNGRLGAFRAWLRQVTHNRCRRYWDSRPIAKASGSDTNASALQMAEDDASRLTKLWDDLHDRHVLSKLLELVECEFADETVAVFKRVAIEGENPNEVADSFDLKVARVYRIKNQVLNRLREKVDYLFGKDL